MPGHKFSMDDEDTECNRLSPFVERAIFAMADSGLFGNPAGSPALVVERILERFCWENMDKLERLGVAFGRKKEK